MIQQIVNTAGRLLGIRHIDGQITEADRKPMVVESGRVGKYMHTSSGAKYWPLDPRADEVDIQVVAHHLATRARYNGATQHRLLRSKIFYSVAEHSCYVSLYLERELKRPDLALEGLLHDGSEAYNGDLIRPLKYDPEFSAPFKKVEELNEVAGAQRFGLIYPYPPEVKIADEAVTTAEIAQIVPKLPGEDWNVGQLHDGTRVAPYEIMMLEPYLAKIMFLDRFQYLWEQRQRAIADSNALMQTAMSA